MSNSPPSFLLCRLSFGACFGAESQCAAKVGRGRDSQHKTRDECVVATTFASTPPRPTPHSAMSSTLRLACSATPALARALLLTARTATHPLTASPAKPLLQSTVVVAHRGLLQSGRIPCGVKVGCAVEANTRTAWGAADSALQFSACAARATCCENTYGEEYTATFPVP
jgi:hypothetical protein